MLEAWAYDQIFGPKRFLVWSKSNELWRTFYRTVVAGHWKKEDVEEFNKAAWFYEVHMDHGNDDAAHLMALRIMERCQVFKAAKVSKLAVNDMKVVMFLGQNKSLSDKVAHVAREHGFELVRIRDRNSPPGEHELAANEKFQEYLDNLRRAFAPMAQNRAIRGS